MNMVDGIPESGAVSEPRVATGMTWHICPMVHWIEESHSVDYLPEQFKRDGFVHCTNDRFRLMEIANLFYRSDPRAYVALEIDLNTLPSLAIYEDEASEFPHVYGRVPRTSVRNVVHVQRGDDGTFHQLTSPVGRL
jgi:uncharacterized protein (DUF952 family)